MLTCIFIAVKASHLHAPAKQVTQVVQSIFGIPFNLVKTVLLLLQEGIRMESCTSRVK